MDSFDDITLENNRLILKRCHYERDAEEINAAVLDTLDTLNPFLAWAIGKPTVEDTKLGLKRVASSNDDYAFKIYKETSPSLIGMIGLNLCNDIYEVGYWCHKDYTGQGIMTEALKTIIDFAKDKLNVEKLKLLMHPHNTASRKLAQKFDFKENGFELTRSTLRPEWNEYKMIIYEKYFQ